MILKKIDSKNKEIQKLESLHKQATTNQQKYLINKDIDALIKGYQGEKEAAYYINEALGRSKNWFVINDLRLESKGQHAQFDHILINRLAYIMVIETKNWDSKIIINKFGEFELKSNEKKFGVESPIEQNKRHIDFLKLYMDDNNIFPKRLGVRIKPEFINMILFPKTARIKRPLNSSFNTSNIIRMDRFSSEFEIFVETIGIKDTWKITRILSEEKIIEIGKKLIHGHTIKEINYEGKYKLNLRKNNQKYYCGLCKKTITKNEFLFCKQKHNKIKFNGKICCKKCQKLFPTKNV